MLGGQESAGAKDKVPVLSDIPYLGHLFKKSGVKVTLQFFTDPARFRS